MKPSLFFACVMLISGCDAQNDADSTSNVQTADIAGSAGSITFSIQPDGLTFNERAEHFRVREVDPEFVWIVSQAYQLRIDPRIIEDAAIAAASEIRSRNTFLEYRAPAGSGRIHCGVDWDDDVAGEFKRAALTDDAVSATFRIELNQCQLNGEPLPEKAVVVSGSFSLPRTDR